MSTEPKWPIIQGDYVLGAPGSPVAVLIIGRGQVDIPPDRFHIMGTVKTENMGLEKVIVIIVSNPRIRFLIVCGKEEFGHFPADAVLKIWRNGIDERRRIAGARSAIPYICNIGKEAVERFRAQVEVVDIVHPKDSEEVVAYDPMYTFEPDRREELLAAIADCESRDPGRLEAEPLIVEPPGLKIEAKKAIKSIDKMALEFTNQMLRLPSERLSTEASLIAISEEMGVVIDPTDGLVFDVPSVEFASKLKSYYRGGT
jgi:tetrahydromethanopterin S-methyltransferase subunit A